MQYLLKSGQSEPTQNCQERRKATMLNSGSMRHPTEIFRDAFSSIDDPRRKDTQLYAVRRLYLTESGADLEPPTLFKTRRQARSKTTLSKMKSEELLNIPTLELGFRKTAQQKGNGKGKKQHRLMKYPGQEVNFLDEEEDLYDDNDEDEDDLDDEDEDELEDGDILNPGGNLENQNQTGNEGAATQGEVAGTDKGDTGKTPGTAGAAGTTSPAELTPRKPDDPNKLPDITPATSSPTVTSNKRVTAIGDLFGGVTHGGRGKKRMQVYRAWRPAFQAGVHFWKHSVTGEARLDDPYEDEKTRKEKSKAAAAAVDDDERVLQWPPNMDRSIPDMFNFLDLSDKELLNVVENEQKQSWASNSARLRKKRQEEEEQQQRRRDETRSSVWGESF